MPPSFDSSQLLDFHRRLCEGDRTASEELAELLLGPLIEALSHRFPDTDEQTIWDGVVDAFLDYAARPCQFNVGRGVPLDGFLRMASRRNVTNALRGEARRRVRQATAAADYLAVVELDPTAENLLQQEEARRLQRQQEDWMKHLRDLKDQQIWAMRLRGERRTEAFAEVLGISHLPIEAQRREVKRVKDRIDKVLRRHGGQA
jgi:RNA polymerase sigma-70 factor (ECF subfamily)